MNLPSLFARCALAAALVAVLPACAENEGPPVPGNSMSYDGDGAEAIEKAAAAGKLETAIFAGGCFWCVEEAFDMVPGVVETISGYTGGDVPNPTYEQVTRENTGHREALRVRYDPDRVSYEQLLEQFWYNIDPTDARGQFCDKGASYRSSIYVLDDEQRRLAKASKEQMAQQAELPGPIVTEVFDAGPFYAAEKYHQDYYNKNPLRYKFYKNACGRPGRLEELWGEQAAGGPFKDKG